MAPNSYPMMAPFERRAVLSLAGLYSFRMLGLFMVLPVLALYGRDYTGSTPFLLGLALGAYGLTQAILQIPFGMMSDRWGRKPVIVGGLILFALGSLVAAQADSVFELILGRALQGAGAIASAIMALVADLTAEENRTKAMAVIGMSIGVSFSIALVLGPLVAKFGGLAAIFWLTALFAVIGLLLLIHVVPTPHSTPQTHRDAGTVPHLLMTTLCNRELQRLNFGIFALHFALMAAFLVLPGILEDSLGLARERHWQVYLPLLILAFVTMIPFIIIGEHKRKLRWVFLGGITLLATTLVFMAFWQQNFYLTLLALFLYFMAFNLLEACLPSLVSKVAPVGSKGTAIGIYSSCQFFGAFAGGALGGWWMELGGNTFVLCGAAVVIALWALVAVFMEAPPYLASVLVSVTGDDLDTVESRLRELPGVEEVVLVEEDLVAYLKVDSQRFNRSDLHAQGFA